MPRQQTPGYWRFVAAASIGGFCWVWSSGMGIGQTTVPPSEPGQTSSARSDSTSSRDQTTNRSDSATSRDQTTGARSDSTTSRDLTSGTQSTRDATRQARDQSQEARDQTRDQFQQNRNQSRGEFDATRDRTQQDQRDLQNRDESRTQSQRDPRTQQDFSRDTQRDDFRTQSQRDQSQRDFTRDQQRDQSQRDQSQRDQSQRDFTRDQQRDQSQRDFSRDQQRDQRRDQFMDRDQRRDQRDQFADRDQRDQYRDDRSQSRDQREQFDERRESFRDDRSFQATRDQRGTREDFRASSRTQISRGADIGLWFDRGTRDALVISDVASSGPIARFGFQEGDQIVSINGQRVTTEREFIDLLVSPQIQNQRVQIVVWRDDQRVPVWVEPWVLIQSDSSAHAQADPLEPLGIVLDDRYQAPVVWKITSQSPAYYSGIRAGDVIVAWNRQYVSDHQDLINLVQQTQANEFPVQISRNRQLRVVTLEVDGQGRTALRPTYDQAYTTGDGTGTYSGAYYQQRTYTQPGTTYVQPGSMYVQPGATYSQPGYAQPGTYNQPQGRPALLPRLRGR